MPLFSPKLEIEQSTVEHQSLFDIIDFERYVVETDSTRSFCFNHGVLHQLAKAMQILSDHSKTTAQNTF